MKIVLLVPDLFDAIGGIQTFNRGVVKGLGDVVTEEDWQLSVLVLNDSGGSGLAWKYLPRERARYSAFRGNKLRFAVRSVRESLRADLVIIGHVHFLPLALVFRCQRIALIVYGLEVWKRLTFPQGAALRRVRKIISVSRYTRDIMCERNGLDRNRFAIVPPAIDPLSGFEKSEKAAQLLDLPPGRTMLTVARLDARQGQKGVDVVLRALRQVLRRHPDCSYVIVGDGTDRPRLQNLAVQLGVSPRVWFTGWVGQQELGALYSQCDIFVLASNAEGFGIALLEAMTKGKPCLSTTGGAIPEVVVDGQTGLLVPPGDAVRLEQALMTLLEDERLRSDFGRAGRERVQHEFAFPTFRERLLSALLLGKASRDGSRIRA